MLAAGQINGGYRFLEGMIDVLNFQEDLSDLFMRPRYIDNASIQ
jgi:hypothetical protein